MEENSQKAGFQPCFYLLKYNNKKRKIKNSRGNKMPAKDLSRYFPKDEISQYICSSS